MVTLFPRLVESYFTESIVARARRTGKIRVAIHDLRDYGGERYRIDDRPYGGGPGMVIRAEPVIRAVAAIKRRAPRARVIILSPGGKEFNDQVAARWAKQRKSLILVAGRYEGIDARAKKVLKAEEVSIGNYTVTGGELPALVILDAVTRRLPGVLGDDQSVEEKRIASHEVYTRPETITIKGHCYRVPRILLSGHQAKIDGWKLNKNARGGSRTHIPCGTRF